MLDFLTAGENLPFSAALGVVLVLALVQVFGLADALEGDADADIDLDSGLLSLVGFGRVPFMVWLTVLLSVFGILGLCAQELLAGLTGTAWTPWLVGPATGLAALPLTGGLSRPLARLLPRDETSAIDRSALVGREGEIVVGTARPGSPRGRRSSTISGRSTTSCSNPTTPGRRSSPASASSSCGARATCSRPLPAATTTCPGWGERRVGCYLQSTRNNPVFLGSISRFRYVSRNGNNELSERGEGLSAALFPGVWTMCIAFEGA